MKTKLQPLGTFSIRCAEEYIDQVYVNADKISNEQRAEITKAFVAGMHSCLDVTGAISQSGDMDEAMNLMSELERGIIQCGTGLAGMLDHN